jgi:acyl dehydratase
MTTPRTGDAMPPIERQITTATIMAYGASTWDWHRMHYDGEYARAEGLSGVVLDGQAFGAYLATAVTSWLGPLAFIRKLSFRMRSMVLPGDTITCVGEVTSVAPDDGANIVNLSQRLMVGDRVAAEATTEVRVPR